ncbi:putative lipid phosphate phosphatase 3, chloroplastic [Impatiens glandulifera]|uniref:putative lipid phosphate phosphatase 3, chloroplastic n=1 Tax=Impatiens glandulifera TaxID=253017 RepID=UPI001FB076EC|nr:putative lipid phosphate phosphatase 3, chloroplastic [Impatiens glandulifera]
MNEVELGVHTFKSHGVQVSRYHLYDLLTLILLLLMEIVLFLFIQPYHSFISQDMITNHNLKYPHISHNTIPIWSVPIYTILLPIVVFLVYFPRKKDIYDLYHSILGLLFAVLITGVITEVIKLSTGLPRPDFFWRCFPNGVDNYDSLGNVICHGNPSVIKEGYRTFPSGHTSWSFAGLGFLTLYIAGKLKVFDGRGHVSKLCIPIIPLILASLVGISMIDEYRHHWKDVFVGGLLGLIVATLCYLQFFPPPYANNGWGPYAYFRAINETGGGGGVAAAVGVSGSHLSDSDGPPPLEEIPMSTLRA